MSRPASEQTPERRTGLLDIFANLSRTHREHEKFYGEAPLEEAAALMRISRALKALAERWEGEPAVVVPVPSPYAGATDLNDDRATEAAGILFMESGEAPAEIGGVTSRLEALAADAERTGHWLAQAMEASWGVAETLLDFPELTDLLAERHGIIARDWQSSALLGLVARQLRRANAVLARIDFTTAGLRADLAGEHRAAPLVFAAAELIDQAAELTVQSTTLVRANERTWRVFNRRVRALAAEA